jgi:hypothetical protein
LGPRAAPDISSGLGNDGQSNNSALFNYKANPGETLKQCLDRLVECTGKAFVWEIIRGQVCVHPKVPEDGSPINNLDARVSINVKDVSTWEACCMLAQAVNEQSITPFPFVIVPAGVDMYRNPLPEIMDERVVTVSLTNVSAREALCAIFEGARIPMKYWYVCGPDADQVELFCKKNGKYVYGGPMKDADERAYWTQENIEVLQGVERN